MVFECVVLLYFEDRQNLDLCICFSFYSRVAAARDVDAGGLLKT